MKKEISVRQLRDLCGSLAFLHVSHDIHGFLTPCGYAIEVTTKRFPSRALVAHFKDEKTYHSTLGFLADL